MPRYQQRTFVRRLLGPMDPAIRKVYIAQCVEWVEEVNAECDRHAARCKVCIEWFDARPQFKADEMIETLTLENLITFHAGRKARRFLSEYGIKETSADNDASFKSHVQVDTEGSLGSDVGSPSFE